MSLNLKLIWVLKNCSTFRLLKKFKTKLNVIICFILNNILLFNNFYPRECTRTDPVIIYKANMWKQASNGGVICFAASTCFCFKETFNVFVANQRREAIPTVGTCLCQQAAFTHCRRVKLRRKMKMQTHTQHRRTEQRRQGGR